MWPIYQWSDPIKSDTSENSLELNYIEYEGHDVLQILEMSYR